MGLAYTFRPAAENVVYLRNGPGEGFDQTYILVSALNLNHGLEDGLVESGKALKLSVEKQDVDEVLNKITKWMRDHDVMDQRDLHGDTMSYGLYFHVLRKGHYYPSCTHQYSLSDYVFAHNRPEEAARFEDLMVMLDRHKLVGEMRQDLMTDYGARERENPAAFWLMYIGQCNRPDFRRSQTAPAFAPEAVPA